ncbi:unnamed protein product [Spirodela intermedia]|uniref:Secreted protein n=1 Tax=Spirodela intermedia TaxID=51605 RepID=A0ABN7EE62_SPIIN|nr:unnamed protein product [Spirodela intermedia]
MAAGLPGCFCLISAAIPAMCGAAMLVPETIANPSLPSATTTKKSNTISKVNHHQSAGLLTT